MANQQRRNNACVKFRWSAILRVAAALLIIPWMSSARAEEVSVSYATFAASYMDHLVAFERGYFTEEGLTLNRITVGGRIQPQTLVANKLDFSSSGSSAMTAAIPQQTCQGCLYQPFTTGV